MQSAIYVGSIRHRRSAERRHEFEHGLALVYLDLDELGQLCRGRLLRRRPGLVRFRRRDYLGDPGVALDDAVRSLVTERTGVTPDGPVRLLTHLRSFGHCFNPVSFYYCYSRDDRLDAVVAEVTNTPWGERHAYVLARDGASEARSGLRGTSRKALHVSPFMGMAQHYVWSAAPPGDELSVHLTSVERGTRAFDATLRLRRHPFDRRWLLWTALRYPAPTVRTLVLIYAHALALRLKGIPIRPRPGGQSQCEKP